VYYDLGATGQQVTHFGVEGAQPHIDVVVDAQGPVQRIDPQLVVVVEVVGSGNDRDDPAKAVLPDPDDLLLAPDTAMVLAVTAGAFTDGQFVLEDPGEVPGSDSQSPLPA